MTLNNHEDTNSSHHDEIDMLTGKYKGSVVEDISEGTSWGKSRCELIGLHDTSGDAPLETPTLEHLALLPRRGIHEGSVVEGAVERTSWGKSRCDRMCRFPNTGGLHLTSGNAPLETPTLEHPAFLPTRAIPEGSVVEAATDRTSWGKSKDAPLETPTLLNLAEYQAPAWCHVNRSTSSSSKRTQVAAVAYRYKQYDLSRHSTIHRRCLNADRKRHKQIVNLKDVTVGKVPLSEKVQCLEMSYIRNNIVVCDGGDTDYDGIKKTFADNNIHYLRIRDGDLWVADTVNPSIGLHYLGLDKSSVFIRLPREAALGIMNNGRSLCMAMRTCALTQPQSLLRGTHNRVFTEDGNKYCCVGVQPGRAQKGVKSGLYRLKHGFPSEHWDILHKVMKRAEYAFDMYMSTEIIRHISSARSRVTFATMEPSPSSSNQKKARYYNGLGFGINVYLRSHIDADFTMSIVQAHIDNHNYQIDDRIVCYFAFPRIGVSVALRPGDFLLFNPTEPHCVSSRCRADDDIYIISSYLKTAIVGLNDNTNFIV